MYMGRECNIVLRRDRIGGSPDSSTSQIGRDSAGTSAQAVGVGNNSANNNEGEDKCREYVWKIGLVPAHDFMHPRMICYFFVREEKRSSCDDGRITNTSRAFSSSMDDMEEDDIDEEVRQRGGESSSLDPPTDGWRVFQGTSTAATGIIAGSIGRASGLTISYE